MFCSYNTLRPLIGYIFNEKVKRERVWVKFDV